MLKFLRPVLGNGFWLAVAFVILTFLLGGGSRADISSLSILRPVAALMLTYALWAGGTTGWRDYRFLILFSAALLVVCSLHMMPLPPAVWSSLPGRDLIVEIDRAAGIAGTWRPLTMAPQDGWNALFSLVVPLAMLVLAIRLSDHGHRKLALVLALIAFASVLIGLFQIQGPSHGPLYFYRITNDGKMVGLFSNRNHNAIFLATVIPVLAYIASLPARDWGRMQLRLTLCVMGACAIFAALVIIGSRAGFVFAILGAISAVAIYRTPRVLSRRHSDRPKKALPLTKYGRVVGFSAVGLVAIAFFAFAQSETMDRVIQSDPGEDLRFQVVWPIIDLVWKYFPLGSGSGSFVPVYQIAEPLELLRPQYLNHAHNDFLEVLLTFGLPGFALMLVACAAWGIAAWRVFRAPVDEDGEILRARLGGIVMGMLALASLVDYPLRTPSIACFFVIAAVWLARGCKVRRAQIGKSV